MTTTRTEVLPSARRLINSLRDIGYDLPTAIADLVDNSIAASASHVEIDMRFEGESSLIRIVDDGSGMTERRLAEAMRFGTRRGYTETDLGKFGLGLKAASLSQSRCLTVATRTTKASAIHIAQWDLDHVEDTDRWEVLRPSPRDVSDLVTVPLRNGSGCVVVLEDLDRLFRFRSPNGRWAHESFNQAQADVEAHLAMVFHRFLAGEAAAQPVPLQISINGRAIRPWDPFCRDEAHTLALVPQNLTIDHGGQEQRVLVSPYVLPNEAAFSSASAHVRAAGPKRWNRQQGFYFYRNDRLIQSGGWSRLRTTDEHTKLARLAVDFSSSADTLFELNVSKTQVRVPPALRAEFGALASSAARVAQQAYRIADREADVQPAVRLPVKVNDVRIAAIHALTEMVLRATEDSLQEELSRQPRSVSRVIQRLRAMQSDFHAELSELVGITVEVGDLEDAVAGA